MFDLLQGIELKSRLHDTGGAYDRFTPHQPWFDAEVEISADMLMPHGAQWVKVNCFYSTWNVWWSKTMDQILPLF